MYKESLLARDLPIKLSRIGPPVKVEKPEMTHDKRIKEPEPDVESVMLLDFIECRPVGLIRQMFIASWHELKTV